MLSLLQRGGGLYWRRLKRYRQLSHSALRILTERRSLHPRRMNRRDMVEALIASDKLEARRTFEGLVRLPPELRVYIFKMAMDAFDEPLFLPVQPPITFANRLLRTESLPIFYSRCRFEVVVDYALDSRGLQDRSAAMKITPSCVDWFGAIPDRYYRHIKRLSVRFSRGVTIWLDLQAQLVTFWWHTRRIRMVEGADELLRLAVQEISPRGLGGYADISKLHLAAIPCNE